MYCPRKAVGSQLPTLPKLRVSAPNPISANSMAQPPLPNPSPAKGEGLKRRLCSPLCYCLAARPVSQ